MIRNRALPAFAVLIVVFASGCASIGGGDHLAEIRILPHQSVQHGADAVSVQTAIGRQHLREGDNAGAISAFERALAAAPHDVDALNARAVAFLRIGRFDAAVADLQAAIAVTPASMPAGMSPARKAGSMSRRMIWLDKASVRIGSSP